MRILLDYSISHPEGGVKGADSIPASVLPDFHFPPADVSVYIVDEEGRKAGFKPKLFQHAHHIHSVPPQAMTASTVPVSTTAPLLTAI